MEKDIKNNEQVKDEELVCESTCNEDTCKVKENTQEENHECAHECQCDKTSKKDKKNKCKDVDITKDPKYIALVEENASLKDQILRKTADFENYKKRLNEERIRDRKYALNDFLMESIEILDIFDKAVNTKTDDEKLRKYLSGFVMINNRLNSILENSGVKKIDCLNKPFDPNHASALETVEVEGVEPNMVVEEVMTGYMYKDRVLRPAMVKVSK